MNKDQKKLNNKRNDELVEQTTEFKDGELIVQPPYSHGLIENQNSDWVIGQKLLDEFRVKRILGQGGMGRVYLVQRDTDGADLAVKTILSKRLTSPEVIRLFYRELKVWIDLPEHDHLTSFRFFRTFGGQKGLFFEYVDGGSLKDWIKAKKVQRLDHIYDVAIQMAWGIHAAHVNGVVHKDIKPANILLTRDRTVKITDFGISSLQSILKTDPGKDPLLSSSSMTAAFCSPEQESDQGVTYKTDIWSYGLTVLTMFTGPPTWLIGSIAPEILRAIRDQKSSGAFPELPEKLYSVLMRCFETDPNNRWDNMLTIAEKLKQLYRDETGEDYPRSAPAFYVRKQVDKLDRADGAGNTWVSPQEFLKDKNFELEKIIPDFPVVGSDSYLSLKTQALQELEWYETLIENALRESHVSLEMQNTVSHCYGYIGSILGYLDDRTGSIHYFDKAIEMLKGLSQRTENVDQRLALSGIYQRKGNTLRTLHRLIEAIENFNREEALLKSVTDENYQESLMSRLTSVYCNRGIAFQLQSELPKALADFKQAVEIVEELLKLNEKPVYIKSLIRFNMNQAVVYSGMGDDDTALEYYQKTIGLLDQFEDESDNWHQYLRSRVYFNIGTLHSATENPGAGRPWLDKAIDCCESYVLDQGHKEGLSHLVSIYTSRAWTLFFSNQLDDAKQAFQKAIDSWKHLVFDMGCSEFMFEFARAYSGLAKLSERLGDWNNMASYCGKALSLMDHIKVKNKVTRIKLFEDNWLAYRALAVYKQGEVDKAKSDAMALQTHVLAFMQTEEAKNYQSQCQETLILLDRILNDVG